MTRFSAKAHTRTDRNYSAFHQSLLHENNAEDYALRHLYSLENTKHLLEKWGWNAEQIKTGIDHATIEVCEKIVYLHIPGTITKRNEAVKIRGISRFISKCDYVQALIDRSWAKADPYKLQPGNDWDELIAMGNTGDFYELKLTPYEVTCTCHAYSGIKKAFEQDAIAQGAAAKLIAAKCLIANTMAQGQIPDKHVFAVWKYLGAENQRQYEYQFSERRERFLEEMSQRIWRFDPDTEEDDFPEF